MKLKPMKLKPILWTLLVVVLVILPLLGLRGRAALLVDSPTWASSEESYYPSETPATELATLSDYTAPTQPGVGPAANATNAALPETAEPRTAQPTNNSGNEKPDNNVPATSVRPIGPIRKSEVRVKEVPVQVQVKKAEVHVSEAYRLKNQDAARIAKQLKEIVPELEITHDPASESIIIQEMTPKMREFVTEVIQRLSAARPEPQAPQPNNALSELRPLAPQAPANAQPGARHDPLVGLATLQAASGAAPLTDAQRRYREAEEQARSRAVGLGLRVNVPPEVRTPKELQSLKNTVTTAFDARQDLLRQELADFRARLDRLAKTLETRERDKDKIIQHRVDELLNPDLRWDASGSNKSSISGTTLGNLPNKNADQQTPMAPTTNEVVPAEGGQVSNPIETLQKFDPNQPPPRETVDVGIVSGLDPGHGQISVSLKDPGSTKVGDVLELSQQKAGEPRSLTPFGRVRVIKVQPSNDSVFAVLTHSTRQEVENGWDWMEPEIGDRVTRFIVDARMPKVSSAARANDFRVGDSAFSVGTIDEGLEFLRQYPRFSGLSLAMTETQFRAFLEQQKLVPQLSIPRDGQLNYSVPLGDGIRLTVMFGLDGKCRGIEPMGGDGPSTILPQPAPPAAVRAEKVEAKIFRLEQVDAAGVAKTLQELVSEKPFSARISADAASNSVIVFGNPDDMTVIEAIIIRLDKDPESATPEASGTSDTTNSQPTPLSGEMKSWQGHWLLASAEINGQEQKRDEVSTQSITVSDSAMKIAVRIPETKGFLQVEGVLNLSSLPGGTKAFTFQTPSGKITRQELETVDGLTLAKDISYELPIPLRGIYEFREDKLVLCFFDQGSKDTSKHPDKFATTPDSDLHLYIFDKVVEPNAGTTPGGSGSQPKPDDPPAKSSGPDSFQSKESADSTASELERF